MDKFTFDTNQKLLRKRLLEISYLRKQSHLGSCLTSIDLIDAVYQIKNKNDIFVLSCGHAAFAWYVVLEKYGFLKEKDLMKFNVHPDRNPSLGIEVSAGSLGQGLPIAVGMALADSSRNIYCLVSDGECAEGSIWESLRIISDKKINNLKLIVNANGWGCYDPISKESLQKRLQGFGFNVQSIIGDDINQVKSILLQMQNQPSDILFAKTNNNQFPFLKDLDAHYYTMPEKDYQLALELLI